MTPGSEQAYGQSIDDIWALDKQDIVYCNMPLEEAVSEAAQLAVVAQEDREALLGAGLDAELLDSMAQRSGAFAYAAAQYQMALDSDPEASGLWKAESPAAYELRAYLLKFAGFAFRNVPDLMRQVAKIKEGRGHKDMVVDLLSLSILCENNVALLAQIPMFDREKIQEARTVHNRLNELLAKVQMDPERVNEAKDIYHRAWSLYKQAADEVKIHGQFLFEGTDRYSRYVSSYFQEQGKDSAAATAEKKASTL